MRKKLNLGRLAALLLLILVVSCRSEFEKIRISGDEELIYEKAMEYYENKDYQKAQTLLELAISAYRGRQESEEIYFRYAYTYYHLEDYILASYYFNNFTQTYSTSEYRQEADFMDAYSNYQLSPSFRLDQKYTNQAINKLQLFVNTYPDSERVSECNRLIDEMRAKLERKAFSQAKLYYDLRRFESAIHAFENVLKDFPETVRAEEIRYMIIRSHYLFAKNSVLDKQVERYQQAVELAKEFLSRFEESQYANELQNLTNDAEEKIKQLKDV